MDVSCVTGYEDAAELVVQRVYFSDGHKWRGCSHESAPIRCCLEGLDRRSHLRLKSGSLRRPYDAHMHSLHHVPTRP